MYCLEDISFVAIFNVCLVGIIIYAFWSNFRKEEVICPHCGYTNKVPRERSLGEKLIGSTDLISATIEVAFRNVRDVYHCRNCDKDLSSSVTIPNLPTNGNFRTFPVDDESLLPIPQGVDLIGEYIEDWTTIKANTVCVVILKGKQDFIFKRVTLEGDRILLKPLSKFDTPYHVQVSEVQELWKYHSFRVHAPL